MIANRKLVASVVVLLVLSVVGLITVYRAVSIKLTEFREIMESRELRLDFPAEIESLGKMNYNWSIVTHDGVEVLMESFRGKTIVLHFWATWCPPCRTELPTLAKLYERMKGEDVAFVIVSQEDPSVIQRFWKSVPYSLTLCTTSFIPAAFKVRVIPKTFIISPSGEVVFQRVGAANWDTSDAERFLQHVAHVPVRDPKQAAFEARYTVQRN